MVRALSRQDIVSVSEASSGGSAADIAGAADLYVANFTTRSFIGNEGDIRSVGSVLISADEKTEVDILNHSSVSGVIAGLGAAIAAPVIDKTTEAFVAAGGRVHAEGLRPAIEARPVSSISNSSATVADHQRRFIALAGMLAPSSMIFLYRRFSLSVELIRSWMIDH